MASWDSAWYRKDVWGGEPLFKELALLEGTEGKIPSPRSVIVVFCGQAPGKQYGTVRQLAYKEGPERWKSAVSDVQLSETDVVHVGIFLGGADAPFLILPALPQEGEVLKQLIVSALSPALENGNKPVRDVRSYLKDLLRKEGLHV